MKFIKQRLSLLVFLFAIALPFNNCSPTNSSLFDANSANLGSSGSSMSVQITATSLGASSGVVVVPPNINNFTVSGTCTTDAYPSAVIDWEMLVNGQNVWDSYMTGSQQFIASCNNGQFAVPVVVPCPGAVNTTAGCLGLTQSYTFVVRMTGQMVSGMQPSGAVAVSSPITLQP